jgi:hypothetical protein
MCYVAIAMPSAKQAHGDELLSYRQFARVGIEAFGCVQTDLGA